MIILKVILKIKNSFKKIIICHKNQLKIKTNLLNKYKKVLIIISKILVMFLSMETKSLIKMYFNLSIRNFILKKTM